MECRVLKYVESINKMGGKKNLPAAAGRIGR